MRVTWATVGESSASTTARVVLGDGRTFKAVASHYSVPSRWWQPEGWIGWLYTAVLTGLEPGSSLTYVCVTQDGVNASSASMTLKVPPPTSRDTPVSFATFGDMGTAIPFGYKVTDKLAEEQKTNPVDFVFHQGDISYAGVDAGVPIINFTK